MTARLGFIRPFYLRSTTLKLTNFRQSALIHPTLPSCGPECSRSPELLDGGGSLLDEDGPRPVLPLLVLLPH